MKPSSSSFWPVVACGFLAGVCRLAAVANEPPAPSPAAAPAGATNRARAVYRARKLCELSDERIDESSGMAASRRYPGYLWTHNDSGDTARLFLLNLEGKTVATVALDGAEAHDWEDMAVAGTGAGAWVYAGDIGDNAEARANIVVYRFHEPELDLHGAPASLTVPCERMTLTYPDGPHNAETLLATAGGDLVIVTKTLGTSQLFKTGHPFVPGQAQQLVRLGQRDFGGGDWRGHLTTGGDLSPDGKRFVVCTYTQGYEWTLPLGTPDTAWRNVWKNAPKVFDLPAMKQAEAICYGLDGTQLYTTSEQRPTPLWELTPGP